MRSILNKNKNRDDWFSLEECVKEILQSGAAWVGGITLFQRTGCSRLNIPANTQLQLQPDLTASVDEKTRRFLILQLQ